MFVVAANVLLAGCTQPFLPAGSQAPGGIPPWGATNLEPLTWTAPVVPPAQAGPLQPIAVPQGYPAANPALTPPAYEVSQSDNPWKPEVADREWKWIVVHHTATDRGSVESIHESHLKRRDANGNSWLGIGYHFVIGNGQGMEDGDIEPTFRWRQQLHGAHAGRAEENQQGIGICLVGNFENHPPSAAQLTAIKKLVFTLKQEYGIDSDHVVGHYDIKTTACPGKHFPIAEIGLYEQPWTFSWRDSVDHSTGLFSLEGNCHHEFAYPRRLLRRER
ncbi:MAG: N-acetylmuramoyl-L-alanine amidase [Planctomyces sp.]|nr:N-acetylmuramoyl-L-alanine amidase [Planctomyces sp.]